MSNSYDAEHARLADHATTADTASRTEDTAHRDLVAGMKDGADNLAEAVAHAEERSDWQDKVAKDRHKGLTGRVQSLTVALIVGCLAVGVIGTTAANQGRQARDAAADARQAATCSTLLDEAVAAKQVIPELAEAGCDTRVAQTVVQRIMDRDTKVAATEKAVAEQRTLTRDATCRVLLVLDPEPTDPAVMDLLTQLRCP